MSIKDDMPFLAKVYETATEEQRQEIRHILKHKGIMHDEDCLHCRKDNGSN